MPVNGSMVEYDCVPLDKIQSTVKTHKGIRILTLILQVDALTVMTLEITVFGKLNEQMGANGEKNAVVVDGNAVVMYQRPVEEDEVEEEDECDGGFPDFESRNTQQAADEQSFNTHSKFATVLYQSIH